MPHSTATESVKPQHGTLYVNDGPLDAARTGYMRASSPDMSMDELHARYNEDGYVLVKGLIPRADVLKAREEYFKHLSPTKVLKRGTQPVEGIFNDEEPGENFPGIGAGAVGGNARPGGEQAGMFVDLCLDAHTQEWYAEKLCKHSAIHDFVAKFTGWGENTKGLTRSLLRNNTPGQHAIGVHYDQIFLRYGEPTALTVWVPIGDISLNGGGLIYLENSPAFGQKLENDFTEKAMSSGLTEEQAKNAFNQNMMSTGLLANGPAGFAEQHGKRWMVSAYEAGDVVLHNPFTIHASTINHDERGVIRLATDLRFVDASKPYDTRWDHHYRLDDGV